MAADLQIIGWCEWARFPHINNERVNMKVDSGARTSSLHAVDVTPFTKQGEPWIRVVFQPEQGSDREVTQEFAVFDKRKVKSSGGHVTDRYVIKTPVIIGSQEFDIELTLTSRENMKFRMLLGRRALAGRYLVDAQSSYVLGE
ncbi:ATP-dependent zinc protease [Shewanella sp. WXL01]|uniref:ATP-dependent zinc protease n=1 Tax=Shewanella maritima TaxID=2520507 RepID=A0A411PKH6_9GAMM|nr:MULTISPECIES: RimK/LysX family protein [Shewanella]NKF51064.1 ATP-dependent zinc protease [Shewanella sp. WXL01]QBF84021.1 ATP-dependent zinc protease [Shewanella maritima]